MKNKILYGLILFLTILLLLQCNKSVKDKKLYKNNILTLSDSIMHYKLKTGEQVASIKSLQIENNDLSSLIITKDFQLKELTKEFSNIKNVVKFNSNTQIDTIIIPLIKASEKNITDDGITKGEITNKWYSLGYTLKKDSLIIAPFKTWTETAVVTGFKRKWLLGKQTLHTDITNTNPYININAIKSVDIIVPEPWYKKWYIWLAVGIGGSLLIK